MQGETNSWPFQPPWIVSVATSVQAAANASNHADTLRDYADGGESLRGEDRRRVSAEDQQAERAGADRA